MNYMDRYNMWLSSDKVDANTKEELIAIKGDDNEIKERFIKELEFGTAGLRGIIGAGDNRMNIYTVRKATQGLSEDIKNKGEEYMKRGVVIAYDSRIKSDEFALDTARVLCANGIKVYLFESLRPVPMLSFAIRYLKTAAGVVITASHNPKEYNGYKAYGEDGSQLPPESSDYITEIIQKLDTFEDVKIISKEEAMAKGLLEIVGEEVDIAYLNEVRKQSVNEDAAKELGDNFKMVYTPFHGAGYMPVKRILEMTGIKNLYIVEEQAMPDGNFPTLKSPNPEDKEGFEMAINLAKKVDADVIVATDPDSDRAGVTIKASNGEYITLTGNQIGVLLCEFILRNKKKNGTLPSNGAVIKTIVTTDMVAPIADEYGVTLMNVLTGFKFIGEKIKEFEQSGSHQYLFGFEESYGYLAGTHARDKDAVVATMLISQMAADYKTKGMTLYEGLISLYEKYGYYREGLKNLVMKGLDGAEKISGIMKSIRQNPPAEVNGVKVLTVMDVLNDSILNLETKEITPCGYPKSNAMRFDLEDGSFFAVRPSGTEPKIKFYFGIKDISEESAEKKLDAFSKDVMALIQC